SDRSLACLFVGVRPAWRRRGPCGNAEAPVIRCHPWYGKRSAAGSAWAHAIGWPPRAADEDEGGAWRACTPTAVGVVTFNPSRSTNGRDQPELWGRCLELRPMHRGGLEIVAFCDAGRE